LFVEVSDTPKETSSTSGMASTVKTSELFQHRVNHVVTKRLGLIEEAITQQNFPVFAQITMQESNQFHAVCLDTYPPIFYMNDVSKSIVDLVTQYNAFSREIKASGVYYSSSWTVLKFSFAYCRLLTLSTLDPMRLFTL
jgi:diphosphomevalonate decarboxylase